MSATFNLIRPIEDDGRTVTTISLREMNVGDLIATDMVEGASRKNATLIAAMSGLSIKIIEKMGVPDYTKIMGVIDSMGEPVPPDGSTPSP